MLAASFSSLDTVSMAHPHHQYQQPPAPAQVAEKVIRRIEIAKVARNLQDCLAFASFKAQNGWQDRTLSTIEPEITEKLARRKRPYPEELHHAASLSSISDEVASSSSYSATVGLQDSKNSAQSYAESRKRIRSSSSSGLEKSTIQHGWRQTHSHAQSSPALTRSHTSVNHYQSLQDSPMFDAPSEDAENDAPAPSMLEPTSSVMSSSPPRTPPPTHRKNFNSKQAGAEMLLYLANSPRTPAVHVQHISSAQKQPATPPSQHAHLPSSVMQTPANNLGLFNGALQTPGNFNLAEFCNVTPSPAQAQFARTPGLTRTPGRLTRRSLNFDTLQPPSPTSQRKAGHGLALQLGDDFSP